MGYASDLGLSSQMEAIAQYLEWARQSNQGWKLDDAQYNLNTAWALLEDRKQQIDTTYPEEQGGNPDLGEVYFCDALAHRYFGNLLGNRQSDVVKTANTRIGIAATATLGVSESLRALDAWAQGHPGISTVGVGDLLAKAKSYGVQAAQEYATAKSRAAEAAFLLGTDSGSGDEAMRLVDVGGSEAAAQDTQNVYMSQMSSKISESPDAAIAKMPVWVWGLVILGGLFVLRGRK